MKKILSLMLCLMLLCVAGIAFADVEKQPGETVTISINVTGNDGGAANATVKVAGSTSVFEFVSASVGGGVNGTAPKDLNKNFVIKSFDTVEPLEGNLGTMVLRVKEGTAPGRYTITVSCTRALTADLQTVSMGVSGTTTVVVPEPECAHEWDDGVVTTEPTCQAAGVLTKTCGLCGETEESAIDPVDHIFDDGTVTKEATCIEAGELTRVCTFDCGETIVETIEALGHTEGAPVRTEPSCEVAGSIVVSCTVCKEVISEEPIEALGHDWDEGTVTTEPTCTEAGEKTFVCANDETHTKTEVVEATGEHIWSDGVTTDATCTEDGKTVYTCTYNCGETKEDVIPAKGHTPSEDSITEPATCEQPGKIYGICSVCDAELDAEEIPALGHAWDDGVVTTEPTCTKEGEKTFTCGNDATHTKTEVIAATGEHKWDEGTVTTEPTCTEDGEKTYKCTYEGCTETKTEVVPAKGHTPSEDSITEPATCEKPGKIYGTCSVCDAELDAEEIPALGHAWDDGVVTTEPTCTEDGEKTFTCDNDATHTYTEVVPAIGHAYDDGVVTTEPTCTEDGVKTFTCANDASHTYTEAVPATGHTWGEWVVSKPATDDEDGEKQRTCEACGEVETKVISAKVTYIMTTCSKGIRFRDLENPVTDYWYMFTPIDLSVDGEQTFDLIAGNIHKIGTVTVVVSEGTVTVTYELTNRWDIEIYDEFMTILPSLAEITELDFETLAGYNYGEAISIQDQLGGDTKVLLVLRNLVTYTEGISGIEYFDFDGADYLTYAEELKQLMD